VGKVRHLVVRYVSVRPRVSKLSMLANITASRIIGSNNIVPKQYVRVG
jgi:hypothetical protein